jgi:hypothetical protein
MQTFLETPKVVIEALTSKKIFLEHAVKSSSTSLPKRTTGWDNCLQLKPNESNMELFFFGRIFFLVDAKQMFARLVGSGTEGCRTC